MDIEFFKRFVKTKDGVRELIKKMMQRGQQNVHTPYSLCKQMIGKLSESCDIKNSKIAVLFNVEFVETLITDFDVNPANIIMFADDKVEGVFCELQYKMKWGENLFQIDIAKTVEEKKLITDSGEMDMKFDVVVGNPPYQDQSGNVGNTLWDKFTYMSLNIVKENGYMCLVHPSKWRNPENNLWETMSHKQIEYLEIHNIKDGIKTFGAATRYDWYVLKNCEISKQTEIMDEDGDISNIDLRNWNFLPNGKFVEINGLLSKDKENRLNIVYKRSAYGADKKWMSENKTDTFCFPCIKYISAKDGAIDIWYSNTDKNGHFGVPKIVFGIGSNCGSFFLDEKGDYGMMQFCAGITADTTDDLKNILRAMNTDKFMELMTYCMTTTQKINYKILQLFRKDFWKEFI